MTDEKFRTFRPTKFYTSDSIADKDLDLEEEHVDESEVVQWRKRNRSLQTKPIYEYEFPTLLHAMENDGLRCVLTEEGYQWYHGRYPVSATSVRRIWGLTEHQWRRFSRWLYRVGASLNA